MTHSHPDGKKKAFGQKAGGFFRKAFLTIIFAGAAGLPSHDGGGVAKADFSARRTAPAETTPPPPPAAAPCVSLPLGADEKVKTPRLYASIVIDAETGEVLSEKNADTRLYPASLTKMMTLYLTFEALEQGRLELDQFLPVSAAAAAQEPSELGLKTTDSIRVEDAIFALTTKSANDCAVVLAEALGGSETDFACLMNARARQLGMGNTYFSNASGLPDENNFSTARDMALLSQALICDYPQHYHYFSAKSFTWRGHTYPTHNKLMKTYKGMDGLKTGYIYASGFNLAASAVRGDTRLIGVVFGGKSASSRDAAMTKLLNQGFAKIKKERLATPAPKGQAVLKGFS